MPRFVILEHHDQATHWDFMLESGGRLRTWRLETVPVSGSPIPATPLPHHRTAYLDYEGPVSGDRGYVVRWDTGHFEWVRNEPDCLVVQLSGQRLSGQAHLAKVGNQWSLSLT